MGQRFMSDFDGTEGVRRRQQTRLAVSRNAWIEPLGAQREPYYEQRLLLTLAWVAEKPVEHEDGVEWHFTWAKPAPTELRGGVVLPDWDIYLGRHQIPFEEKCKEIDDCLSHWRYGLVCNCCAGQFDGGKQCKACEFAVGFHRCAHNPDFLLWRKSSGEVFSKMRRIAGLDLYIRYIYIYIYILHIHNGGAQTNAKQASKNTLEHHPCGHRNIPNSQPATYTFVDSASVSRTTLWLRFGQRRGSKERSGTRSLSSGLRAELDWGER